MTTRSEAYQEKLEAQLNEWSAKVDVLKAKAARAEADAKVEYLETLEELKIKREKAEDKLKDLRDASGDALEDLKKGVDQAVSEFKEAVSSATSRFH